jgi:hypothetical protein
MTAEKFRSLALEIAGAIEASHMGHPDFRVPGVSGVPGVGGKIFASLGYPDDGRAVVMLSPGQQRVYLEKEPGVFTPCAGAWGRQGSTSIDLAAAKVGVVRAALKAAARHVISKTKD